MQPLFRFGVLLFIAAALVGISSTGVLAARSIVISGGDVLTVPARPAGARELPPSRVRLTADVTWGVPDARAVAAFRAARTLGFMSGFAGPNFVEHAGEGYYLDGTSSNTYGAYANHVVYPRQREPGNPSSSGSGGFLYAPTMFGPGADCIEATTVVQDAYPQVWAWDWCSAYPDPYAVVVVDGRFKRNYIRTMTDGLTEFTVETILASDGVTWDMALYNYKTQQWDIIYQTSGSRNPNYGLGEQGWDFFETYTDVENGISDVCNKFPGPIASDEISLSFDDETFTPITSGDSTHLKFNSFYCSRFGFSTPQTYEWEMLYSR